MDNSPEELREELRRARARIAELEQLANVDALVPLGNRRALKQAFDRITADSQNSPIFASLALIDLVGLKEVNERLGYAEGDKLLVCFAQCLHRVFMVPPLGAPTLVVRLGGDEFVVLAVEANASETEKRLTRLSDQLSLSGFSAGEGIGCNSYTAAVVEVDPVETLESLIARADRILTFRKRTRRAGLSLGPRRELEID